MSARTWLTEPADLTSEWAHQRIKPIGWRTRGKRKPDGEDAFRYPVLGPGQLWEAAAARLADSGVVPSLESRVVAARFDGTWTVELDSGETASGDAVFSSMPLRLLLDALEPAPPRHIRAVAGSTQHRALITVAVALRQHYDIPTLGLHAASGCEGRSHPELPPMVEGLTPDGWDGTYLGLEYYFGPTDDLYALDDESVKRVVAEDLHALGVDESTVERVMIVRSRSRIRSATGARQKCCPHPALLRQEYPSLHPIGRNGMHRYDNQDHAMLSACRASPSTSARTSTPGR